MNAFRKAMAWFRSKIDEQTAVFLIAALVGLCSGVAAAALKWLIHFVAVEVAADFDPLGPNWPLLLLPVAGILLTGFFQRRILHADLQHGTRQLAADLRAQRYTLPAYLCYGPMIASTFTLGFGGSAGSEGPIAYTGAAIGSNIGRAFRLDSHLMLIMVGCGAGAGIAGIFKAPVGGFLFALEVLKIELTTMSVMACLLACVTSAMTAYVLAGCTVDLSYIQPAQFQMEHVPYILLLGVICGFYSLYYSYILRVMENFYTRVRRPWVRNLVSGSVLAVILYFFPSMYGEGYGVMGQVINGHYGAMTADSLMARASVGGWAIVAVAAGIALMKCFAHSATNCGGGVGGDFAPTLFAGCIMGFLTSMLLNTAFGLSLPVGAFAFLGMAGVMAGAIQAPMMALFLTAEMTNGFVLFLPLLAVSGISYGIARIFRPVKYYSTI